MAWKTSLTESVLVSTARSKTRQYITRVLDGKRRHREQSFSTVVVEHRNMSLATAEANAAAMASDILDGGGNRTQVTADVQRQNEAGAYKIIKTTAYTSAWSEWTDYQ